jgi:uncharacterized protein (DUF58 family)
VLTIDAMFQKSTETIRRWFSRSQGRPDSMDPVFGSALPLSENPLAALGQLEMISRRMADGLLSGKHRSTHRGGCTDFTEHRPYSNGDDVRMIDWRMHAKNDRYHIKQYEDETNLKAILAVDASGSMSYSGKQRNGANAASKFDIARTVASCLARIMVRQRDAVGLAIIGETISNTLPPRCRPETIIQLNEALAVAKLQGRSNLGACLTETAARNRSRGMLILLSDCLCSLPDLKKGLLAWAQAGHDVIVVEVLAADEIDFSFRGSMILENLEQPGQKLDIDPGNVRHAYLERMQKHRAALRNTVTSCRGELISIRNDESIGDVLKRFLQRRASSAGGASAGRARR